MPKQKTIIPERPCPHAQPPLRHTAETRMAFDPRRDAVSLKPRAMTGGGPKPPATGSVSGRSSPGLTPTSGFASYNTVPGLELITRTRTTVLCKPGSRDSHANQWAKSRSCRVTGPDLSFWPDMFSSRKLPRWFFEVESLRTASQHPTEVSHRYTNSSDAVSHIVNSRSPPVFARESSSWRPVPAPAPSSPCDQRLVSILSTASFAIAYSEIESGIAP